jgi:hypothetical protein
MPFVLLIAGIVLLIAAVRDSQCQLYGLIQGDFTGDNNFITWFLAILVIGAIGYVPKLKPVSDAFLILVIIVLFLRKGTGFFSQLTAQTGLFSQSGISSTIQTTLGSGASGGMGMGTVVIGGVTYPITQTEQH